MAKEAILVYPTWNVTILGASEAISTDAAEFVSPIKTERNAPFYCFIA